MSTVHNVIILVNDYLEKEQIQDILDRLKPMDELNPETGCFKYIEKDQVGGSRNLEENVFIGAVHRFDYSEFDHILNSLDYHMQLLIKSYNDEWWTFKGRGSLEGYFTYSDESIDVTDVCSLPYVEKGTGFSLEVAIKQSNPKY